jgi:cytochrome c oxidase subunit III
MPTQVNNSNAESLAERLEEHREKVHSGGGAKPPIEKPPTGGGGGGNEEWRDGQSGPRSNLKMIRLALLSALAGDFMALTVLIALFFVRHSTHHWDRFGANYVPDWYPLELPPILYVNTAVLLMSALTMEVARRHIFREIDVMDEWLGLGRPALKRALPWLCATLMLGVIFLLGQLEAWRQLVARGFSFVRNVTPASNTFYILTGFHMLHLLVGVAAIGGVVFLVGRFKRLELRQIAVDATAWSWMAMCAMWLIIFGLLVFAG